MCAVERVGGEEIGFVFWEGVFEEFADDQGLIDWSVLVFQRRNLPSRVDLCDTDMDGYSLRGRKNKTN